MIMYVESNHSFVIKLTHKVIFEGCWKALLLSFIRNLLSVSLNLLNYLNSSLYMSKLFFILCTEELVSLKS